MSNKKAGNKKRRCIRALIAIIFAAVALFAGYKAVTILTEYKEGTDTYKDMEQYIHIEEPRESSVPLAEESSEESEPEKVTEDEPEEEPVSKINWPKVDFEALQQAYPDVVGWIYIEGTAVNYPIVHGLDNDYYLYRMSDGSYNSSGSIFMDCRNIPDFSDRNTVIYGHHMNNGSMFSDLLNYKNQEYFDEHPRCLIMTPEQNYTLEFFTGYVAATDENAWDVRFNSEEDFDEWLKYIAEKTMFDTDLQVKSTDRVVTLSTCSYEFSDARFVMTGILKAEE